MVNNPLDDSGGDWHQNRWRVTDELAREHGMSVGTFYAWKAKFGGMSVNEAQRLRALEEENRRLKTLVADLSLDVRMLQSVVEKKS